MCGFFTLLLHWQRTLAINVAGAMHLVLALGRTHGLLGWNDQSCLSSPINQGEREARTTELNVKERVTFKHLFLKLRLIHTEAFYSPQLICSWLNFFFCVPLRDLTQNHFHADTQTNTNKPTHMRKLTLSWSTRPLRSLSKQLLRESQDDLRWA